LRPVQIWRLVTYSFGESQTREWAGERLAAGKGT
jgi:hypothetical protein